ncbi:glutamate receptor U1-like [Ornithodoros turicata]|uniref:glutamate receptor U1-like n=1 Tax=Ornithodoros turicata TaxID=34597 RepID=UPI003139F975
MTFLSTLSQHFNFTFTLVPNPERKFGGVDGERWSGMIGMVHRKEVDVSLGGLSIFYNRVKYVDYIYPYIVDCFAFVTKVPRRMPFTHAIVQPFRIQVWLSLLASLAVGAIVLRLLQRWTPDHSLVGRVPDLWLLLATLAYQSGWRSEYQTTSYRIFRGTWLVLAVVLAQAYCCVLLAVLSVPQYEKDIDTVSQLEEAIKSGKMRAGTANGTAQVTLIQMSTTTIMMLIRRLLDEDYDLLVPGKALGLEKAIHENYGYIDTRMGLVAALSDLKATTVKVSAGHMGNTYMSMAVQRNCFYRPHIDTVAQRFLETGHFIKWLRDDAFRYFPRVLPDDGNFSPLTTSDLVSAVIILLGGFSIASVVLAVEVFHFRYQARRKCRSTKRGKSRVTLEPRFLLLRWEGAFKPSHLNPLNKRGKSRFVHLKY